MLSAASADAVVKGAADAKSSELASNAEAACKSDDLKAIREGFNMFVDSLPGLLKILDDIANVHPFIKGLFNIMTLARSFIVADGLARSQSRWAYFASWLSCT